MTGIELAELALAFVFGLMAWNAARQNRLDDARYWERDAERRRILNPITHQPYVIDARVWGTTSTFIGVGTDFGHTHQIQRAWLKGQ